MTMTDSWGCELWDKYGELSSHTSSGIEFLESYVASFVRERGKVEARYAVDLRALVKKFSPKEVKRPTEEEFTHMRGYKQMLKEVGFLAGQHEVLAESFTKEQNKGVISEVKRLKNARSENIKEANKITADLKMAHSKMDKAKVKFRKAYEEQERSAEAYKKANDDGSVTRNEVTKMRGTATKRSQECENAKGKYASQLVNTNDFQTRFYTDALPRVLDGLQRLEEQRIEVLRTAILTCVNKEREVAPIVAKCHDTIVSSMRAIDPLKDTCIIIERYKSGDVPPGDCKFEGMSDPAAMLQQDALEKPSNLNLYPRKREVERHIEMAEQDLAKKQKELHSLQQMVATYQSNPKFGNAKQFQGEIQNAHTTISEIESALIAMRADKAAIEHQLESLKSRSPRMSSPAVATRGGSARRPPGGGGGGSNGSSSHSSGSLKSLKSLSISSQHSGTNMNTSPDSSEGAASAANAYPDEEWDNYEGTTPPPPPPLPNSDDGCHQERLNSPKSQTYQI